jgi:hypothetical protein
MAENIVPTGNGHKPTENLQNYSKIQQTRIRPSITITELSISVRKIQRFFRKKLHLERLQRATTNRSNKSVPSFHSPSQLATKHSRNYSNSSQKSKMHSPQKLENTPPTYNL